MTKYFVYGFGDADGADYIFTTTDKDIYYKTGTKLGGTAEFPDYYSIYTTGTQGIKRPTVNNSTDYDEAAIYVGCYGASEFSLSWQTKGSTTNDFLTLPSLYYAPGIVIWYNMNGGYLSRTHGSDYKADGDWVLRRDGRMIHFLKENESLGQYGLYNYNSPTGLNVLKTGYNTENNKEFNTAADGSGTELGESTNYSYSTLLPLAGSDKVLKLYINWKPINYNISYTLNGGQNASGNPTTYDITSNDKSISNPTRTGYTFSGWNYSVTNLAWEEGMVHQANGANGVHSSFQESYRTGFIKLKAGHTYTLSGYGDYSIANDLRWFIYDTNKTYLGETTGGKYAGVSYTPTQDCYVKIVLFQPSTTEQRTGLTITTNTNDTSAVIPEGSTGDVTLTANWTIVQSNVIIDPAGGSTTVYNDTHNIITTMSGTETINTAKTYTGCYNDTLSMSGTTKGPTSSSYNYEITYLGNDGIVGEVTDENVIAVKTVTTTYTFDDWTKNLVNGSWGQTSISGPGVMVDGYIFGPNANMTDTLTATYTSSTTSNTTPVILANATRPGYTLKGWYTASTGGTKRGNAGDTYTPSGNETLYAQWTANTATVTIKRDNSNWTTNNSVLVELRSSTNTYNGTKSGATVTWTAIPSGTYDIYASKNDTNQTNINTLIDTGIDVVVSSTGTATIDYYSLQLQAGVGISAVSGVGTYLKNQQANIDATVATGYTWEGWSVISGNTPN